MPENMQRVNEPPKSQENAPDTGDTDQTSNEPYLGPWKTREAAEEGVGHLQKLLDSQGNELGTLRKMVEMGQQPQQAAQPQQPQKPQGPDFDAEIQGVQKSIADLDPDDPGYQKDLGQLILKSNQLASEQATQRALEAAQNRFSEVLNERDQSSMHTKFLEQNPDFDTPEMQAQIQQYMAQDRTGMVDELVAYREVQRDQLAAENAEIKQKQAEMERLLNLKKGEDQTGKVVTKGQSPQSKTRQPKATGEALDQGLREAFRSVS